MKTKCSPVLSGRRRDVRVVRRMEADAPSLYRAWTERFDVWFAEPGELLMTPRVDAPYFFHNRREWGTSPHYGRFLRLENNRLVEMTWVTSRGGTGKGGTEGAETLLRVELRPRAKGTDLRLTHWGFANERSRKGHADNWPAALEILDERLKKRR
ncbi:MAG: SRPBCC domain-containing protein [Proteobacteria bacterium]|nr:SRPBCC domain-containing protein [Pseudomonadota bacterium]